MIEVRRVITIKVLLHGFSRLIPAARHIREFVGKEQAAIRNDLRRARSAAKTSV